MAMLDKTDKQYIEDRLTDSFTDFEKKIDTKFSQLVDHMNDQFSRILKYVEQIDKRLEQVGKKTDDIPLILIRLDTNEARLSHAEATLRDHTLRLGKI